MASYDSGELFWDTTEATAPRWVLLLDGPPEAARRRVDPQDLSLPQAARPGQLRELIRRAFHADTGHWPVSVTLTLVKYKQRFRQGHSVFEFNTDESECLCWLGCEPAAS